MLTNAIAIEALGDKKLTKAMKLVNICLIV